MCKGSLSHCLTDAILFLVLDPMLCRRQSAVPHTARFDIRSDAFRCVGQECHNEFGNSTIAQQQRAVRLGAGTAPRLLMIPVGSGRNHCPPLYCCAVLHGHTLKSALREKCCHAHYGLATHPRGIPPQTDGWRFVSDAFVPRWRRASQL